MLEYVHRPIAPGVHQIVIVDMILPPIGVFIGDFSSCPSVLLSDDQFRRYNEWQANKTKYMIDVFLPDLTLDEQEILVTGKHPVKMEF